VPPPPSPLVPIAATMNCDTEAGTDSRDGSTSVHSPHSSDISPHSSDISPYSSGISSHSSDSNPHSSDVNHYSSDSSSHSSRTGSHSSIPDLLSSTTVSRDGELGNNSQYSDEEYEPIIDVEGLELEQHDNVAEEPQPQEEWYVDTGYLNKIEELASKLEYATRTMELALDRMTRMSERLEIVMIEMRRAIDTMNGREVENDGSVSRGLFELTVTHLLDRIRRYEIIDFVSNVYTEGARIAGLRRPNS
jgi:hypothetical protein